MIAVSVCVEVSGYRKGYSSLPEANVQIGHLTEAAIQCFIVRNK